MHVVALAAGPAHALYFSCYEKMKVLFSGASQAGHSPVANGLAGCFATLLHDALMVPSDGMSEKRNARVHFMTIVPSDQTTSADLCLSLLWCNRLF
jgi:hypothetical protein